MMPSIEFDQENLPFSTRMTANALIFTKTKPGFSDTDVAMLKRLAAAVARGAPAGLKFLIVDFAHRDAGWAEAGEGFDKLVESVSELVMEAPVITIAWVRGQLTGRDLEFALNCSSLVAEENAQFSFAGDPFKLFGVFAALGRKIGFVQTERLIETDAPRSAEEMRELMLVRDIVPAKAGFGGIDAYVAQAERRYNAAQAVFRAQKMLERRQAR